MGTNRKKVISSAEVEKMQDAYRAINDHHLHALDAQRAGLLFHTSQANVYRYLRGLGAPTHFATPMLAFLTRCHAINKSADEEKEKLSLLYKR